VLALGRIIDVLKVNISKGKINQKSRTLVSSGDIEKQNVECPKIRREYYYF
jgi:predicted transcriptional regulator